MNYLYSAGPPTCSIVAGYCLSYMPTSIESLEKKIKTVVGASLITAALTASYSADLSLGTGMAIGFVAGLSQLLIEKTFPGAPGPAGPAMGPVVLIAAPLVVPAPVNVNAVIPASRDA